MRKRVKRIAAMVMTAALVAGSLFAAPGGLTARAQEGDGESKVPIITGLTLPETVATEGTAAITAEYDAGDYEILWISAIYNAEETSDQALGFYFEDYGDGKLTGEGSVELTCNSPRRKGVEYSLDGIYITAADENGEAYFNYYLSEEGQMAASYGTGDRPASFDPGTAISFIATESSLSRIAVTGVRFADGTDKDHVASGDTLKVIVSLYNGMDETLMLDTYQVGIGWRSEGSDTWQYENDYSGNSVTIQRGESGEIELSITVNKYAQTEKKLFAGISINQNDWSINYNYGSNWISANWYQDNTNYEIEPFDYNGELDYYITEADTPDTQAPTVSKVELVENEIGTNDDVQVKVTLTEDFSGVHGIGLSFVTKDGKSESWWDYSFGEQEVAGENQVVTLKHWQDRTLGEEYQLTSVDIQDYSGKETRYWYNEETGKLTAGEKELEAVSYQVTKETEKEAVYVSGYRLEAESGKDQLTAGDSYTVVYTIKNTMSRDVLVEVNNASWTKPSGDSTNYWIDDLEGDSVLLKAGEECEYPITLTTSTYAVGGGYAFRQAYWTVREPGADVYIGNTGVSRNWDGTELSRSCMINSESLNFTPLAYGGELDYTIAKEVTPDDEAPYVTKAVFTNTPTKAPGQTILELTVKDEGLAKLESLSVSLGDVEASNNVLNFYLDENEGTLYYSTDRKCYVARIYLENYVADGTYEINRLYLTDQAGNEREYSVYWGDGVLMDVSGNAVEANQLVLEGSENQSRDFEGPVLKGIEILKKDVAAPGAVRFRLQAEDASGVGSAGLTFRNQEDDELLYLNADSIVQEDENNYLVTYTLKSYQKPGDYRLTGIWLTDNSGNSRIPTGQGYEERGHYYMYDQESASLTPSGFVGDSVPYTGEADFVIAEQSEEWDQIVSVEDADLIEKLESVPAKGSVVITDARNNGLVLSEEAVRIMKESDLQVTLCIMGSDIEISFRGSGVTSVQNLYVTGGLGELRTDTLSFANEMDTVWYPLSFWRINIPAAFTMRFEAADDAFAKAAENGTVRLAAIDQETNTAKLLQDHVTYQDGYVELSFASDDELKGGQNYAVSTGTEKIAEKPLSVTVEPQLSSKYFNRGSSFEATVTVTNENEETLQDVVLVGNAWDLNTEEDVTSGWNYAFTSEDSKVQIVKTDTEPVMDGAYIASLAPGESVRFTAEVTIDTDCAAEAMEIYFGGGTYDETTDEMTSYGADSVSLILQNEPVAIKGDINLDGVVDMEDLLYMLKVVSGRIGDLSAEQVYAGDVAGADSQVDMEDLLTLLKYVSGRISSFD